MKKLFLLLLLPLLLIPANAQEEEENFRGFYGLDNLFNDPNSIVKLYKSGGFSLKNYDLGIAIFAHPVNKTDMFNFIVIENGKVSRFPLESKPLTDKVVTFPPVKTPVIEPKITERIEPKSSVGKDITKYDIPTISRDDGKTDFIILVKTDRLNTMYLDREFEFNASIQNGRTLEPLVDAKVSVEIVRDDFLLKSSASTTENGGQINIDFGYLTYPMFYPGFCYDVNVNVEYGNYTHVWTDDFEVSYLGSYWNPDTSWIGQSAYSHYPEEYKTEPRSEIRSDTKCN